MVGLGQQGGPLVYERSISEGAENTCTKKLRISAFHGFFPKAFHVYTTKGLVKQPFRYPNHGVTFIIKLVLLK